MLSLIGENWREKKDHILKPLQLDLQLEKSLLPNDTRLPRLVWYIICIDNQSQLKLKLKVSINECTQSVSVLICQYG